MERKTITLHLDGDTIPAAVLIAKATDFLSMLRSIDRAIATEAGLLDVIEAPGRWVIDSIHAGSPVAMRLRTETEERDPATLDVGDTAIAIAIAGLGKITAAHELAAPPDYFDLATLEHVYYLSRFPKGQLRSITVSASPGDAVTLTEWTTTNVARFLRVSREIHGTVEGTLQMVSVAGQLHFHVKDSISGRAIRCDAPDDRIEEVARALGKRVAVFGRMQVNQRGEVLRIKLEVIRIRPGKHELPPIEEILTPVDLTEGMPLRDFIKGLRDAG